MTKRDGVDAARRCGIEPVGLREDYEKRLSYYMSKTDFGPEDVKYSSYLNVYTGLVAYEILRDAGFTEEEAFAAYNYVSAPMRKVAHAMHRVIDVVPGGFSFIRRTIISDLTGSKRLCWSTKLIRNDNEVFEYKITRAACGLRGVRKAYRPGGAHARVLRARRFRRGTEPCEAREVHAVRVVRDGGTAVTTGSRRFSEARRS